MAAKSTRLKRVGWGTGTWSPSSAALRALHEPAPPTSRPSHLPAIPARSSPPPGLCTLRSLPPDRLPSNTLATLRGPFDLPVLRLGFSCPGKRRSEAVARIKGDPPGRSPLRLAHSTCSVPARGHRPPNGTTPQQSLKVKKKKKKKGDELL